MISFKFIEAGRFAAIALALGIGLGGPALSDTPGPTQQPAKPVDLQNLSGHWYEVARVPNMAEKDCPFATADWQPESGGRFLVTHTCSVSAHAPATSIIRATADPLDPAGNAKWRMSYFGGLIHREYWIMDHAANNDWVILVMPGKSAYVWVMSRQPDAPQPMRTEVLQRIAALGYDASRLQFPPAATASRG